jgi:hypothetical protein
VITRAVGRPGRPPGSDERPTLFYVDGLSVAAAECCVDILAGRADEGYLSVMHQNGTVDGDRRNKPSFHQVNDQRSESGLNNVSAQSPDDRLAKLASVSHPTRQLSQRLDRQDVRQLCQKSGKRIALVNRLCKAVDGHLARPLFELICPDL